MSQSSFEAIQSPLMLARKEAQQRQRAARRAAPAGAPGIANAEPGAKEERQRADQAAGGEQLEHDVVRARWGRSARRSAAASS